MRRFEGYSSVAAAAIMAAVASAPASGPASAQSEESSATAQSMEYIVVTAQKREQSLQDVPISLLVADGEQMRDVSVTNLNDLANRLSNVRVNNAGASDSLSIRGVGSGFNMGFEQAVATFVDGVYLSRSQISRGGFLDLERIEVLKGPQSTYFGSNAIAGALSIITRKPTPEFEGYVSALFSPSDNEYDIQAAVGGPLTDELSARAALRVFGMDGFIDNLRFDFTGPRNRNMQARTALRYEKTDVLDVDLKLDYAKYDEDHAELQETVNCPEGPEFGGTSGACGAILAAGEDQDGELNYITRTGDSSFELESFNASLTAAWTLGDHTLTSTTGYYTHDLFRTTVGGALLPFPTLNTPSGLPLSQPEDFNSFSQELRFESDTGGRFEYMAGLYYDRSNLEGGVNIGFYFAPFWALVPPPGVIPANSLIAQEVNGDQDQANRSIFGAVTLNVTDSLRINAGARYSSIRKEAHRTTRAGFGDNIGQVAEDFSDAQFIAWTTTVGRPDGDYPITEFTNDKFMPSVSVQYDVTPDVMAFVSFSTGFKAGGWSIGQSQDVYGPETVNSYEGGIKASWLDRRLTTNVSVYSATYDDLQVSTTVIDPITGIFRGVIGNVGKSRSRGVDLEIGARPADGVSFFANIGYLDAKFLEYPNGPCTILGSRTIPGCVQDLAGARNSYAPKWSGSVNGNYAFDLTSNIVAELGAWLYFTSEFFQQANADPLTAQSAYAKLDLRAAISTADGRWELAIIAKNVTDQVTGAYRAAMPGSGAVSVRMDRPRSVAFQLSTKL